MTMRDSGSEPTDRDLQSGSNRIDLTVTLYEELRRLARSRMALQLGTQTLQATALLHEAWLRLGGDEQPKWESRAHFFSAVAEAMRHILVDRARRRQCVRHGGALQRVDMDLLNWEEMEASQIEETDRAILLVDEVLETLSLGDPETANLIKLRYFAGLSNAEAAEVLSLSTRTVDRRIAFAHSWLKQEIHEILNGRGDS